MKSLRLGSQTWLLSVPGTRSLSFARAPILGIAGRMLAVVVIATAFALITLESPSRADPSLAATSPEAAVAAIPDARGATETEARPAGEPDVFQSKPLGIPTRFGTTLATAPTDAFTPRLKGEWREEEFAAVDVVDGRTLQAGRVRIRLIGIDLPMPEQVCRTLDGRLEYCLLRAATQLELLTRWKRVTCHYRAGIEAEAIGRCRIGTSDLTERMVRTGFAWRSEAPIRD